jgi:hypothetical protein
MQPTLGELFRRSRGAPIEFQGRTVHALFEHPLSGPEIGQVELRSNQPRPEGVCVTIVKGSLLINGQQLPEAVLWADTAPACVTVVCQPKGASAVLRVWNTWKDEQGTQHAWIGNAGMLVEIAGECVILRCSDGMGDVDFDDLIVSIRFETAGN